MVTQRDSSVEIPGPADLFPTATKAVVKRAARSGEKFELLVLGIERVALSDFTGEDFLSASFTPIPISDQTTDDSANPEIEALHLEVVDLAIKVLKHANVELPAEFARAITGQEDPLQMAWMLASVLSMDVNLEHALLAVESRADALRLIHAHLSHELQILEIRGKIATKAQNEMGKEQREYVLRQQLRAIQQELGGEGGESELELLRERLKAADLPEEVRKEADREMSRLGRLSAQAPDYNVGRTWIELILELLERKPVNPPSISRPPAKSSRTTTMASKTSRSASSNTSECLNSTLARNRRSSASSDLPVSAKPRSVNRSPAPWAASSSASAWAACMTKRNFGAIAEPTSEPWLVASSRAIRRAEA